MELRWYIIILTILKYGAFGNLLQLHPKPRFAKPLVLYGNYSTDIVVDMGMHRECIVHFPSSSSKYPYTVFVWSNMNDFHSPILVTVRQQKAAVSWELPLNVPTRVNSLKFFNTSRTLCHNSMDLISRIPRNNIGNKKFNLTKELSISLTTFSDDLVPVTVRVEEFDNFYLEEHTQYSINISPSEPRFFYYKFPQRNVEDFSTTVVLEIESEDEICLTVSIQNASCPVYDLNQVISFKGKYQTIDTKGGIIIKKSEFRSGFFIVFVAKGDNFDCSRKKTGKGLHGAMRSNDRSSNVLFTIKPTIHKEGYVHASLLIVVSTFLFYAVVLTMSWVLLHFKFKFMQKWFAVKTPDDAAVAESAERPLPESVPLSESIPRKSAEEIQCKDVLMLSDLAKKNFVHHQKTSYNYVWHLLSIAIFYGIPVVQLVISHQRMVNTSGNQDLCYYNFLCAHPLLGFSDFNHIFSNIGYVLAGIAFFIIIVYRERSLNGDEQNTGIPKQYGLYLAMSVALIMEGVLSACYHICPSQSNFQFDTSFMYIMVTLSIVKLYQNRHPDVNATAYATFLVLGFGIFAAMVGIISGHIVLWIMFVIIYISLCMYISLKIYFVRDVMQGLKNIDSKRRSDGLFVAIRPVKRDRFYIVLFGNVVNILMATMLCYVFYGDFATYLLALLIANAVLYTSTYIFMKKRTGERISVRAKIFAFTALITWGVSGYFFINNSTDWTVSAAKSRQLNTECVILGFYDYHDIWHLLSAPALFFSFMMILCMDDDIANTNRDKIVVF